MFWKILEKFQDIGYKGQEAYLGTSRRSLMERIYVNSSPVLVVNFLWKKSSIIDIRIASKYTSMDSLFCKFHKRNQKRSQPRLFLRNFIKGIWLYRFVRTLSIFVACICFEIEVSHFRKNCNMIVLCRNCNIYLKTSIRY